MPEHGKSNRRVGPTKPPNNGHARPAEAVEGTRLATGHAHQHTMVRTQRRVRMPHALERVRHVASRERKRRFTTLLPHVYHLNTLRRAYFGLNRAAVPGSDGVTWQQYGEHLEDNLQERAGRLQRGAYRATPTRRSSMAKADGRQRPLGITALEDTIVQAAVGEVLNAVDAGDFRGFSSGCRPGRHPHEALDALSVGRERRKVNWVLHIDIRGFFDAMVHGGLVQFIAHRIADRRIVRRIQKWLKAGVLEDGKHMVSEVGSPQGASVSPLAANISLPLCG